MRCWRSAVSLSPGQMQLPQLLRNCQISTAVVPDWPLSSLKNCPSDLKTIRQVHSFMITHGLDHDNIVLAKFIDACSSAGHVQYAYSVFADQPRPNTYLHNKMIRTLSLTDDPVAHTTAVIVYRKIRACSLSPDTYSFPFVLKVVIQLSDVWLGRQVHGQTVVAGLNSSVHVVKGLIQMYSSCGTLRDACQVFDETRVRDATIWNTAIAGYAKAGEMDEARVLLEMMPSCLRNVVSWTIVISGYEQSDRSGEAIELFQRMQTENVEPDEVAVLAALSACANLGALELGERIQCYVDNGGLNRTLALNNALIHMYAKSGNITRALEVFKKTNERSIVTWTTMISGLALHGLGNEALNMFNRMEKAGVIPNDITFVALLSACSHVGLVDLGRQYFSTMRLKYGIEPKIEHYGCMIDLLGRAGFIQEAEKLAMAMPFEPNAAIWGSLLAASNIHKDLDLGERALKHVIRLEPNNSGNYMLLSNLYSNLGRWNESKMMRETMRGAGVKKMSGGSSIEVRNRVHQFIAGDTSHPQLNKIHELLQEIDLQIKLNGLFEVEYERAT